MLLKMHRSHTPCEPGHARSHKHGREQSDETKPRIRVVAAEISNAQGHFLLTQRNMRAVFPLL